MWIWATIISAVTLGLYDTAKKQAVKKNSVLNVLLLSTILSTILLIPFFSSGTTHDHIAIIIKAFIVTVSWISGLLGIKYLPLTISSTIKASRPAFVLIFSILLFGERLSLLQWCGVAISFVALYLLSVSSKKESIDFLHSKGVFYMLISVLSGVISALYDKHIMSYLEPLFVQSWCNLYIAIILGVTVLGTNLFKKERTEKFKWDWTLVVIAVLITIADYLYFYALSCEGAMLSIVSLVRRFSAVVAFTSGALLFKEHNIRSKAYVLLLLIAGMVLIVLGTN